MLYHQHHNIKFQKTIKPNHRVSSSNQQHQQKGQGNNMTPLSLTPEQKAVMCNPSDKFVNDTESSVCGIPPTPTNTTTSSAAANT
jgi:hypothetical protein